VDSAWEQEKLKARKMLVKRADDLRGARENVVSENALLAGVL